MKVMNSILNISSKRAGNKGGKLLTQRPMQVISTLIYRLLLWNIRVKFFSLFFMNLEFLILPPQLDVKNYWYQYHVWQTEKSFRGTLFLLFGFLFCFCSASQWTPELLHVRQVLYLWVTSLVNSESNSKNRILFIYLHSYFAELL